MTKSTKHKKEYRKEKNKIKLKLTARAAKPKIGRHKKTISHKTQFLPKGLNVTDTSFKSKKIVLPENFRSEEGSGVPVTPGRKQSFKELVSHMGHFNSTIKQDGVNGMRELLVKFPDLMEPNLSTLFGKLSELVSVGDAGVRKCSLRLLDHILQSLATEKISPFFPLLNAQLMCLMNHIALDIQKDSHLLLDILLNHVPALVATVVVKVLPNFLDQISCRDDSKSGKRILAINPAQRLTSLKWRQEVLTRIYRLLSLVIQPTDQDQKGGLDAPSPGSSVCVNFEKISSTGCCPLYIPRDFKVKLDIQPPGHHHLSVSQSLISGHPLQEFIGHLLPLLTETWIEALASEQLDKNQVGSLIGSETCALLTCVTNVLLTLRHVLERSEHRIELLAWFEAQIGEPLLRHFIQRFPFSTRLEANRGKSKNNNAIIKADPNCREQNIILCFLWTQLINTKNSVKYAPTLFQYICDVFQTGDRQALTPAELNHIKNILLCSCHNKSLLGHVDSLIGSAIEFSRRIRPDRRDRVLLNRMLMEVGQSVADHELDSLPALKEWIEICPTLLLREEGSSSLLGSINRIMSRNSASLANGRLEVARLLATLPEPSSAHGHYDWKTVFDFLFWTRDANNPSKTVDYIQQLLSRFDHDQDLKSYGLGILQAVQS